MSGEDPEMAAMLSVNAALSSLEPEVAQRVLRWAGEKFGVPVARRSGGSAPAEGQDGVGEADSSFDEFADLMSAAGPTTDVERVLVGSYWFQALKGEANLTAQQVNTELKQVGHTVKNVTDAFSGLIDRKPQFAIQVQKAGSSRQARKKYKLTTEGIKRVRQLISTASDGEQ